MRSSLSSAACRRIPSAAMTRGRCRRQTAIRTACAVPETIFWQLAVFLRGFSWLSCQAVVPRLSRSCALRAIVQTERRLPAEPATRPPLTVAAARRGRRCAGAGGDTRHAVDGARRSVHGGAEIPRRPRPLRPPARPRHGRRLRGGRRRRHALPARVATDTGAHDGCARAHPQGPRCQRRGRPRHGPGAAHLRAARARRPAPGPPRSPPPCRRSPYRRWACTCTPRRPSTAATASVSNGSAATCLRPRSPMTPSRPSRAAAACASTSRSPGAAVPPTPP